MKRISLIIVLLLLMFSSISFAQNKKRTLFSIKQNNLCGYINKTGKIIITPQFNTCWKFSEGLAGVIVGNKLGFINETGIFIVPPQFNDNFARFSEGFATIKIGDSKKGTEQRGVVDRNGIINIFPSVDYISDFSEGLASFQKGKLYGYFDINMNVAIEPQFEYAGNFNEGFARVTDSEGKIYYIDKSGKKAIDRDGSDFSERLAFFEVENEQTGSRYGFIDTSGKTVIQPTYKFARFFYEGLCAVQDLETDKWGFIDKTGKFVIKPQFNEVDRFSEGLAGFNNDGKWGYIDKTGKIVISAQFDATGEFENGVSPVKIDGDWNYYIDKTGKFIWKPSN